MPEILFAPIEPRKKGMLPVTGGHTLYWELSGNPKGKPVIFLHGGPGGATAPSHRRFFDPDHYNILLFDQRGCGKSVPHASIENNTTWHLVDDIELLREHVGFNNMMVFGGSWGSTLALAYAQKHPNKVTELVLRGIFTFTDDELSWFMGGGAAGLFPDAWDVFKNHIPKAEHNDLLTAYVSRMNSSDLTIALPAAKRWATWEFSIVSLLPSPETLGELNDPNYALAIARLEGWYFANQGFLNSSTQLLDNAYKLARIPTTIVHGRYDAICSAVNAWRLKEAMPHAELHFIPDAGHSAFENGIVDALIKATNTYK